MACVYWSIAPLPPVEELETLRASLDGVFPLEENRAYFDALMGQANRRVLPRITAARLGALSLLPAMLIRAGIEPATICLTRDEHGRPYGRSAMEECIPFDFNLSHSDAHVACALLTGGGRVGVDAEELVTPKRALPLIDRFCTEGEKKDLEALTDVEKAEAFTRMWTIREALSKQDGRGMPLRYDASLIPDSVRVFCTSIPLRRTQIALCVPTDVALSDLIEMTPYPALQWKSVE